MYINPKPKRQTPLLRIAILSLCIIAAAWFLRQIVDGQAWARPFDPTPTPTPAASFYLSQGDLYNAEGKLQQAIDAYEQAIRLEPENDLPYVRQARLLVYTRDTAKALIRAEKAVSLNPNKPENLAGYCQALDWEGQYALAADACECAIELDPSYAPGYAYLSEIYADQALWRAARTTAQEAIDVDFQSPEAHHNMGYALEVQGRYREAAEFYENAITLRPRLAPFYLSAGQAYYSYGQFEEAADRFGEAIKLNPIDPVGYDQLGWTYYALGDHARAIDALQQAISVNPTYPRAWGRLAVIYYQRQNYEEAIRTFPVAIDLSERQYLKRARELQIFTQIEGGVVGPEMVPVLSGRFVSTERAGELVATLEPISWVTAPPIDEGVSTCGDLIAQDIRSKKVRVNPAQDLSFSQAFTQTTGLATLDTNTGELRLEIEAMPFPERLPYEVRLRYRPETIESVGFVQPDRERRVEATFTLEGSSEASVSYYYGLGLSYAYLDPPRCEEAIPWLLKAVRIDPAYYNPGWAGLRICPSPDSPPTPLPTFTPTPEDLG